MDLPKENLTYRAWIPFDYTLPSVFYLVFTHQLIGMMITAAVNVACDSLVSGLLQQICCQLEILKYRLTKVLHDHHILRDCIRHHNRIYELVPKAQCCYHRSFNQINIMCVLFFHTHKIISSENII